MMPDDCKWKECTQAAEQPRLCGKQLETDFTVPCGATCAFYSWLLCHSWSRARPYLRHLAFFSGGDMLPWGSCYARLLWRQSPSKARAFKACGKSCKRCGHVGAEHRTSDGFNQVVIDRVGCKTSGRWIFIWARIQLASRQPGIPSS